MKRLLLLITLVSVALCQATTRPIQLTWSIVQGALGYNMYKSSTSGGPYTKMNTAMINGSSFTDPAATVGQPAFYVGTSVGTPCAVPPVSPCGPAETGFSNEVGLSSVPARSLTSPPVIILVIP